MERGGFGDVVCVFFVCLKKDRVGSSGQRQRSPFVTDCIFYYSSLFHPTGQQQGMKSDLDLFLLRRPPRLESCYTTSWT